MQRRWGRRTFWSSASRASGKSESMSGGVGGLPMCARFRAVTVSIITDNGGDPVATDRQCPPRVATDSETYHHRSRDAELTKTPCFTVDSRVHKKVIRPELPCHPWFLTIRQAA